MIRHVIPGLGSKAPRYLIEGKQDDQQFTRNDMQVIDGKIQEIPQTKQAATRAKAAAAAAPRQSQRLVPGLGRGGQPNGQPPQLRGGNQPAGLDPLVLVGVKVKIKWDSKGPLTADAVRDRGKVGTYYKGKLTGYKKRSDIYDITYNDGVKDMVNLNNPKRCLLLCISK